MVKYKEFKLGDLFEIQKVKGINKSKLVNPNISTNEYDYVTRTSLNNGIESTTDFVCDVPYNEPNTFSLGLLQMTFFYRERSWYAGQFVRKIIPKFKLNTKIALYFNTIFSRLSKVLLSVLVRHVDNVFRDSKVRLPVTDADEIDFNYMEQIDFNYMEQYIAELEQQRLAELDSYLKATGLNDYGLTDEDKKILAYKPIFQEFKIVDLFNVVNTHSILKSQVANLENGNVPYLTAAEGNNAVLKYINCPKEWIDEGNCVFIGGKTMVVTYQEKDFCSNDSHNLALYFKDSRYKSPLIQQYFVGSVRKALSKKYSWDDSISKAKIRSDSVRLPVVSNTKNLDFNYMEKYIRAIEKLTIAEAVKYKDREILTTESLINKM
ncbi:restriction endonuclease subunit S [Lactobacillus crispatus]|uniref:restriction endonuclease subunit S n=1 Tax=Lactobacillus crispatus TaxID=47770 RepID=UPI0018C30D7A|nr:restriction endonuclease subunit S [Lactobacillus crispatus]MCT7722882.1 restriction endonuclease subunit S [Lactobacillus crispatus]MCT7730936.1 restriction endonuclease subunit S [Lactobacillus crispatus]MDX5063653.1 restriction endonuclease subunit S [Lactobacillus crispatus]MDX5105862.1 restriction endonuclease subunit S [Lactobacillus crispatus]WAZ53146.1 restriction endonuclease subunit S [Lactobacillus crispatus]